MKDSNDTSYNINFFKPIKGIARDSNRLITLFLVIWFVAVFGFQFLLIATNKLTPEQTLITFREVWPSAQSGEATAPELQELSKSLIMVLGKNIAVSEPDKVVLKEALSMTVVKLTPGQSLEPQVVAKALSLETTKFGQIMTELLPHSLVQPESATYDSSLPDIMEKYCIHPQGPLTNLKFLGFPFHYWYTAQFLLILFVLLCLVYALRIEKLYRKNNFVEEHD